MSHNKLGQYSSNDCLNTLLPFEETPDYKNTHYFVFIAQDNGIVSSFDPRHPATTIEPMFKINGTTVVDLAVDPYSQTVFVVTANGKLFAMRYEIIRKKGDNHSLHLVRKSIKVKFNKIWEQPLEMVIEETPSTGEPKITSRAYGGMAIDTMRQVLYVSDVQNR